MKQQGDGAGETSTNDKLRVAWQGLGNTRASPINTANRAPNMLVHHDHANIPVCTISILWNFHTNPYHPSKNYELKQQGDGASETSTNDKLRVAWHGLSNTRARRTNTAKRAPNMLMHRRHVPVPVCTISILWNFHTDPYHSSETTS